MKEEVYAPPEPIQTPPEESLALVPMAWNPRVVSLLASSGVRLEDMPPLVLVELGCEAVAVLVAVLAVFVAAFVIAVVIAVVVAVVVARVVAALLWLVGGWFVVSDTVEGDEGGLGLPHPNAGSRARSARSWTSLD